PAGYASHNVISVTAIWIVRFLSCDCGIGMTIERLCSPSFDLMLNIIEGRTIAEKVYVDLRREIAELKSKGITPGLAVVLVGDDPASRAYVRSKDKMSRELGLHSAKLELPESTSQVELLARIEQLNRDHAIHGILVQSPPPKQIDE